MDSAAKMSRARTRSALLLMALAPLIPQLLGSVFNIWYNNVIIQPMLVTPGLKNRFFETVIVYNLIVFPVGILLWLTRLRSFAPALQQLRSGIDVDAQTLVRLRRRLIHLPWYAAAISAAAWFLCIPVFLVSLWQVDSDLPSQLLWHLPISLCISGFISVTHSIFLVELASHWGLFPVFFS